MDKRPEEVIEHLQLVFIELPKFPVQSSDEKHLRLLWLRFMREIGGYVKEAPADFLAVPEISEALRLTEEMAYSDEDLIVYDRYWDVIRTEKTLSEGRYSEGLAVGRAEVKASVGTIARNMFSQGLPLETIAACTQVSLAELKHLLGL